MTRKWEFTAQSKKTGRYITGDLLHGQRGDMYICTVSEREELDMEQVQPETVFLSKFGAKMHMSAVHKLLAADIQLES